MREMHKDSFDSCFSFLFFLLTFVHSFNFDSPRNTLVWIRQHWSQIGGVTGPLFSGTQQQQTELFICRVYLNVSENLKIENKVMSKFGDLGEQHN